MYLWHSGIRRSSIVRAIDDDIRPIYTEKDSAAISTTTSSACFWWLTCNCMRPTCCPKWEFASEQFSRFQWDKEWMRTRFEILCTSKITLFYKTTRFTSEIITLFRVSPHLFPSYSWFLNLCFISVNPPTYTKSKFLNRPNLHQKQVSSNHFDYRICGILSENLLYVDSIRIGSERIIPEECNFRFQLRKLNKELVVGVQRLVKIEESKFRIQSIRSEREWTILFPKVSFLDGIFE